MKSAVVWVVLVGSLRAADAGRYCGADETFAPGEGSTLPIGPTIAMHVEHAYFQGSVEHRAAPTKLKITLDGKPVKFTTKDVRIDDGLIRYITIKSKATGALVITSAKKNDEGVLETFASYTIAESFSVPAKPSVALSRGVDRRLDVYRMTGHFAKLRVELPAISFAVKWRPGAKARWRTETREWRARDQSADPTAGFSEVHIGESVCGMVETVPVDAMEAGVEIEITAKLPDGKNVKVDVASPLVIPRAPKKRGETDTLDPFE